MLSQEHIRSLEILRKFVAETPKDELSALLNKYRNLGIKGPTFDQYLVGLEHELNLNNLFGINHYDGTLCLSKYIYIEEDGIDSVDTYINHICVQPPNRIKLTLDKKDPEIYSGSFF